MIPFVIELAQEAFPNGGTILEFGVGSGGSYIQLTSKIINGWPCKLIGFDSFQGLPKETEGVWRREEFFEGQYSHPKSTVENKLKDLDVILPDKRFTLVEGWLKDTLTIDRQQNIENVILVNVDVDIYISAISVLNFITPLVQKGALIYFDDWEVPDNIRPKNGKWGEQLAFEEWTLVNPQINFSGRSIGRGQFIAKIK